LALARAPHTPPFYPGATAATYNRHKAIDDIQRACIADDAAIRSRAVVLKDVLRSVPIGHGSIDHGDVGFVLISVAAKSPDTERIKFRWQAGKSLTDQSDETIQIIGQLL
jgi:hypothetical protein